MTEAESSRTYSACALVSIYADPVRTIPLFFHHQYRGTCASLQGRRRPCIVVHWEPPGPRSTALASWT